MLKREQLLNKCIVLSIFVFRSLKVKQGLKQVNDVGFDFIFYSNNRELEFISSPERNQVICHRCGL